jgi:hypothetical protein
MKILEEGTIANADEVVEMAIQFSRIVIPNEADLLTHWWKCEDDEGPFLYVGTPDTFSEYKDPVVEVPKGILGKLRSLVMEFRKQS